MTSLDDSIITRQNLMLLDNITNYNKPALDYFHHSFNQNELEMPLTWSLLLKMRKHKLLRLPNCSIEDDSDYSMYSVRLHHCLWRRWSMEHYKLNRLKVDPLTINWDKEIDITVLYGPDLISCAGTGLEKSKEHQDNKMNFFEDLKHMSAECQEEDSMLKTYDYSSSLDSNTSSIFDSQSPCTKVNSNSSNKSLKFNDIVLRRDIDTHGACHESHISINDARKEVNLNRRRRHHRHHHRHQQSNSHKSGSHHTDTHHIETSDFPVYLLPDYDDDQLQQNIKSLNLHDNSYIGCS